jgi:hypothetical protein
MLPPEEKWIKPGTSVWFDEKHLGLGMVIESYCSEDVLRRKILMYWVHFAAQDKRFTFVHERVVNAAKKIEKIKRTRKQNAQSR